MSGANSWLQRQRKSDLVEIAENVGLKNYESLKKNDLESALDDYLAEHTKFSSDPKLSGYYQSRAKAIGSPVKKEKESAKDEVEKAIKVTKRRITKAAEDLTSNDEASATRTPGRTLSLARRIPLPATPADVANAVDRSTVAVRKRVTSMYQESGINEATQATRESLSTVTSVLFTVAAFELYCIRPEILADRYAFTIPALSFLGTKDYPVHIPDMFLLLTASFWSPAILWTLTSIVIPSTLGYFYNLTIGSHHVGRPRKTGPDYVVDPLTFSIVKALVSYIVYAQGVTFGGLVDEVSVNRINGAVYGGWKGILVGTSITALVSVYDAVLRK